MRQNKVQMLTIGKFYFVFLLGPENNFGYAFNTGYGQQQIHTNDVWSFVGISFLTEEKYRNKMQNENDFFCSKLFI